MALDFRQSLSYKHLTWKFAKSMESPSKNKQTTIAYWHTHLHSGCLPLSILLTPTGEWPYCLIIVISSGFWRDKLSCIQNWPFPFRQVPQFLFLFFMLNSSFIIDLARLPPFLFSVFSLHCSSQGPDEDTHPPHLTARKNPNV